MKFDPNCFYCAKSQQLHDLMIEVASLDCSTLYLFKEQTHRGRCVVAHREHTKEIFDLHKAEFESYMRDVARAAKAVYEAVKPDKLNYGAYADKNPHLHFHLVPKYRDGYSWGAPFELMPEKKIFLSDEEYDDLISKIKSHL